MSTIVQIVNGTFNSETHQYWNAKHEERPSVTQIMESMGFVDYDDVPGDTLEHKRKIGDAAHIATHFLDQGDLDWDTVHEEVVPYVLAYENFKKETGFVPEPAIEAGGIGSIDGMEYGYTIDRVGRMVGIKYRIVLEIKCAYREEKSWKWQLAGYQRTVPRLEENEHIARVAVQLKKDGNFKLWPYENPRDFDVFRTSLYLTWVKINEGIKWRKKEQK